MRIETSIKFAQQSAEKINKALEELQEMYGSADCSHNSILQKFMTIQKTADEAVKCIKIIRGPMFW